MYELKYRLNIEKSSSYMFIGRTCQINKAFALPLRLMRSCVSSTFRQVWQGSLSISLSLTNGSWDIVPGPPQQRNNANINKYRPCLDNQCTPSRYACPTMHIPILTRWISTNVDPTEAVMAVIGLRELGEKLN